MILFGFLLAACSGGATDGSDRTTVNVFAAASLTNAFSELGQAFESANPDLRVELNLAGSSSLRSQILDGAPADVFASANEQTMTQVIQGGAITGPAEIFATNRLTIAVPDNNPGKVNGLADFGREDLFIGLCNQDVPCGSLAIRQLEVVGVTPEVDSFEPDVRALLTKIAAGELDAGLVYLTDIRSEQSVVEVEPDTQDRPRTRYPIATVDNGPAGTAAGRFVDFVLGPEGQEVLAGFGFGKP